MGLGIRSKLRSLSHMIMGDPPASGPAGGGAPPPDPGPPRPRTSPVPLASTAPSERGPDAAGAFIDGEIAKARVVIFMKGNPAEPRCGFSAAAVEIAQAAGVEFHTVDVLSEPGVREGIKARTQWPTIPQVFIDGKFVGGSDIFREMWESGEVRRTLSGPPAG